MLIKFSPQGEVLWAKEHIPFGANFWSTGLDAQGAYLYYCGYEAGEGPNSVVIAKVNSAGNPVWIRRWNTGDAFLFGIEAYRQVSFSTAVIAVGEISGDAFVLRLNEDGVLLSAEKWGGADDERLYDIALTGPFNPQYWFAGQTDTDSGHKALLVEYGSDPIGKAWDASGAGNGDDRCLDLLLTSNNQLWMAGETGGFEEFSDGLLLGFSDSGAFQAGTRLTRSGTDCGYGGGMNYTGDAMILGGWCDVASGANWEVSTGDVSDLDYDWQPVAGALVNVAYQNVDINGTVGNPSTAVLDTGGGDADCLIAVYQLP
jgi:hypothetical protein